MNCIVMNHPLITHKVSLLKDKQTEPKDFKSIVKEISMLMCYELTRELPLREAAIESPMGIVRTQIIAGRAIAFVPILRGGLGMLDGLLELMPNAKVGHIGAYRDPETKNAVVYYEKLPDDVEEREVIICDPMLATGGLACETIAHVKKTGCKSIKFLTLIASRQGVERVNAAHPDVTVYCAGMVDGLDENGFIAGGFGDIGARLFGTK